MSCVTAISPKAFNLKGIDHTPLTDTTFVDFEKVECVYPLPQQGLVILGMDSGALFAIKKEEWDSLKQFGLMRNWGAGPDANIWIEVPLDGKIRE